MSTNNGSDAPVTTDAPATAAATDANAVGRKLLEDLQNKFSPVASPETVQKLVQDGILPEGSTVIDFGTLKGQLDTDQRTLRDIQAQQPIDTTDAARALTDAQTAQTAAQKTLDDAQARVTPLEQQIQKRQDQDDKVKNAFNTIATTLNQTEIGNGQLTDIVNNPDSTPELRDAANVLLGTIHDETYGSGRGLAHRNTSDYSDFDMFSFSGGIHFNWDTVNRGGEKHEAQNNADRATLAPLLTERDSAKAAKDAADNDLTAKQTDLNNLNDQNLALTTQKQTLSERVQDEQAALDSAQAPGNLDAAGRVTRGGGYYQVAEALLGIPEGGHSTADEKELKMLTRILQNEERLLNGGKLPKYLKVGDQLLAPENLSRVMQELAATLEPAEPVQQAPAVTGPAITDTTTQPVTAPPEQQPPAGDQTLDYTPPYVDPSIFDNTDETQDPGRKR
ncbi:MAG: hypothetical protein JSS86_06020 [Cyanobacteria bacterium SZAS LIN-2]|nr:hypothetical protein [Cyanobacteria bacterium SZAS LIN-2]